MNVRIGKPYLKNNADGSRVRLCSDIFQDHKRIKSLWYEVEKDYEQYLCDEIVDAFVVAILPWCMMQAKFAGSVQLTSESLISEKLKHQLNKYLIPTLAKNISYYKNVEICIQSNNIVFPSAYAVGTGISGGVDSSYSIASTMSEENKSFRLTHGVCGNIGIYYGFHSKAQQNLEKKCRKISKEAGINYMNIKSNVCVDIYEQAHAPIVPFIFMSMILAMQKLFKVYYFSSAFTVKEFEMSEADAAYFDILTTQYLGTENLTFYSSGMEASRLEKVSYISAFPFTYHNLSVCLNVTKNGNNCGRCAKCTRTMAELYVLKKLDLYKSVFDMEEFLQHPAYHWGYILLKSRTDPFCREIVERYKQNGERFSIFVYLSCMKKWIKRGFTSTNRKRKKVENIIPPRHFVNKK